MFDIVLLTASHYINPEQEDQYYLNVLEEDALITHALRNHGLCIGRRSWDDPSFDWSTTKFVLFRAVWDYFERYDEFANWYGKACRQTQFINSKTLIDWNVDKRYLKELLANGINIPKTIFIEPKEKTSLKEAILQCKRLGAKSDYFVLKPCIAGGARHTYKISLSEIERYEAIFQNLIDKEAMMVQEFQENIVTEGEMSIMVFQGIYTHSVLKKAKKGDFRVQDDWGGTVSRFLPKKQQIEFSQSVINAAPELPTYARVDVCRDNDGQLTLMELEVFEPELWFRFHEEAAKVLAKAITEQFFT